MSFSSNFGELVINVFSTSSSAASFVETTCLFISAHMICLWYLLDPSSHIISGYSSKAEGNSALGLEEDWEVSNDFSILSKRMFETESNWSLFSIILMSLSLVSAVLVKSSTVSFPNFAVTPKSVSFFTTSLSDVNLNDFLIPTWGLSFLQSRLPFTLTTILSLVTLSLDDLKGYTFDGDWDALFDGDISPIIGDSIDLLPTWSLLLLLPLLNIPNLVQNLLPRFLLTGFSEISSGLQLEVSLPDFVGNIFDSISALILISVLCCCSSVIGLLILSQLILISSVTKSCSENDATSNLVSLCCSLSLSSLLLMVRGKFDSSVEDCPVSISTTLSRFWNAQNSFFCLTDFLCDFRFNGDFSFSVSLDFSSLFSSEFWTEPNIYSDLAMRVFFTFSSDNSIFCLLCSNFRVLILFFNISFLSAFKLPRFENLLASLLLLTVRGKFNLSVKSCFVFVFTSLLGFWTTHISFFCLKGDLFCELRFDGDLSLSINVDFSSLFSGEVWTESIILSDLGEGVFFTSSSNSNIFCLLCSCFRVLTVFSNISFLSAFKLPRLENLSV